MVIRDATPACMAFIGMATSAEFKRMDTDGLRAELAAIDPKASLVFGRIGRHGAMWVDCSSDAFEPRCVALVEAQAARLGFPLYGPG